MHLKRFSLFLRHGLAVAYLLWSLTPTSAAFRHSHADGGAPHAHADAVWALLGRTPEEPIRGEMTYRRSSAAGVYAPGDRDHAAILGFLGTGRRVDSEAAAPLLASADPRIRPGSDVHTHERFLHGAATAPDASVALLMGSAHTDLRGFAPHPGRRPTATLCLCGPPALFAPSAFVS